MISSKWKLIESNGEISEFYVTRDPGCGPHYEWVNPNQEVKTIAFIVATDEHVADFVRGAHGGPDAKVEEVKI